MAALGTALCVCGGSWTKGLHAVSRVLGTARRGVGILEGRADPRTTTTRARPVVGASGRLHAPSTRTTGSCEAPSTRTTGSCEGGDAAVKGASAVTAASSSMVEQRSAAP